MLKIKQRLLILMVGLLLSFGGVWLEIDIRNRDRLILTKQSIFSGCVDSKYWIGTCQKPFYVKNDECKDGLEMPPFMLRWEFFRNLVPRGEGNIHYAYAKGTKRFSVLDEDLLYGYEKEDEFRPRLAAYCPPGLEYICKRISEQDIPIDSLPPGKTFWDGLDELTGRQLPKPPFKLNPGEHLPPFTVFTDVRLAWRPLRRLPGEFYILHHFLLDSCDDTPKK